MRKKCLVSSLIVIFPLHSREGGGRTRRKHGVQGREGVQKASEREGEGFELESQNSAILQAPLRTFEGLRTRFPPASTQRRVALTML